MTSPASNGISTVPSVERWASAEGRDITNLDLPPGECLDTEQVPPKEREAALLKGNRPLALLGYLFFGTLLGFVFMMAEVVSWFRIQEMFRFQSFHMYGIIGTAVATAAVSLQLIRRMKLRTLHGEPIAIEAKEWGRGPIPGARYMMGGTLFGMGWALIGACPGPLFVLIGGGVTTMIVPFLAALAGTWGYAVLRTRLPH